MILEKTNLKAIPKNCLECPIGCGAPLMKNRNEPTLKIAYTKKRHPDCGLIEIDDEKLAELLK